MTPATLCAFLAPSAFEARSRARERTRLGEELIDIDKTRAYCDQREPMICARIAQLQKLDSESELPCTPPAIARNVFACVR